MALQIAAREGDRYLLVDANLSTDELAPPETQARILDAEQGTLHGPRNIHNIFTHCPYFEPYDGDETAACRSRRYETLIPKELGKLSGIQPPKRGRQRWCFDENAGS